MCVLRSVSTPRVVLGGPEWKESQDRKQLEPAALPACREVRKGAQTAPEQSQRRLGRPRRLSCRPCTWGHDLQGAAPGSVLVMLTLGQPGLPESESEY